jgi:ketosteroid isomerase-like protein
VFNSHAPIQGADGQEIPVVDAFDAMMVALRFNESINAGDLNGLVALMTPDHRFIDKTGHVEKGRDAMKEGWKRFFAAYPDYRNVFIRVQAEGPLVIMIGYSTCSYGPLDGAALWSARIREGRVVEWRVYEDTVQNRTRLGLVT